MTRIYADKLEEEDCFGGGAETSTRGECAPQSVLSASSAVLISCTLAPREEAAAAPVLLLPPQDGAATRQA